MGLGSECTNVYVIPVLTCPDGFVKLSPWIRRISCSLSVSPSTQAPSFVLSPRMTAATSCPCKPASAPPYLRPTQFFWRALISKHTESQIFPPKRSRRGTEDLPQSLPCGKRDNAHPPGIVRPVNFLSPQSRFRLAFLLPSFTLTTATQVPTFKLPSA